MHTRSSIESKSSTLTFTYFSKLPLEIREKIWSDALPLRLVGVHPESAEWSPKYQQTITLEAIPVSILQACREARDVGLRSYVKICPPNQSNIYTWIDLSRDTLFFEYSYPQQSLAAAMSLFDVHEIQSFAIDIRYDSPYWHREQFTQLRELIFVAQPPVPKPKPTGKTGTILKYIEAGYKRRVPFRRSQTFADVENTIYERYFRGYDLSSGKLEHVWIEPVFGLLPLMPIMVFERVQCDHTRVWNFGSVQLSSELEAKIFGKMLKSEMN
jgi:hypothetical protein